MSLPREEFRSCEGYGCGAVGCPSCNPAPKPCTRAADLGVYPPEHGHCTREAGHVGPCAYVVHGVDDIEERPRKEPFWNRKSFIDKTPWFTTLLLEGANFGQLHRMWTEHTAEGQSLQAWVMVCLALILWWNFYRVNNLRSAYWATLVGILINLSVVFSVIYWRYLV